MRLTTLLGLIIAVAASTLDAVAEIVPQSPDVFTSSPLGAWSYYESPTGPNYGTAYFPTQTSDYDSAVFQSYVHPDSYYTPIIDGDLWGGIGVFRYEIFSTYITSSINQQVAISVSGDDGHSVFVNDQFVGGAPFGGYVDYTLSFQAGIPLHLVLADYNSGGPWAISIGLPNGDPQFPPFNSGSLESVPGLSFYAWASPSTVPEPSSFALLALGGVGLAVGACRRRWNRS